MAEPYFRPLTGGRAPEIGIPQHDRSEAARIAADEEMMLLQSLGRPHVAQPELPLIKTPELSDDFQQRLARLDDEILQRGVAVNSERLVSLGRERFARLLALDRKARTGSPIGGSDLTRWEPVQNTLGAFECASITRRSMREQLSGSGKEREQVRVIHDWADLWKSGERLEILDNVYAFHDAFEILCFGQSILEQLSGDSRVRSHLFCGGKGRRVELLRDWLDVAQGAHSQVKFVDANFSCFAWLANEKTTRVSHSDLAREFFSCRSPSRAQVRIAQAVVDAFLFDYRDWQLWQFVGRETRTHVNESRLSAWRMQLSKRYSAIANFLDELRAAHYVERGFGAESHRVFDSVRHRLFLERTIEKLLDTVGAVTALAIKETCDGALVARFQDSFLCEGEAKQRVEITAHLVKAFPDSSFGLQFEKVQP
jgi:hypothetical protein